MSNLDPMRIQLGNTVTDVSSGFTGAAVYREHQLNGNIRYAVQPKCKADEPHTLPEALVLDHNMLDVVDAGVADRAVPIKSIKFEIGQKARCKATKFTGSIVRFTEYMNGCVLYLVQEEVTKGFLGRSTAELKEALVEQESLEAVGVNAKLTETREEVKKAGKSTGGPMTRAPAARAARS